MRVTPLSVRHKNFKDLCSVQYGIKTNVGEFAKEKVWSHFFIPVTNKRRLVENSKKKTASTGLYAHRKTTVTSSTKSGNNENLLYGVKTQSDPSPPTQMQTDACTHIHRQMQVKSHGIKH